MEQLYKVLVSVLYADKAYGKTNAINMWTDCCSPFGASISKCCGFVVSVSPEHTTWDTTPFPGPHTADPKFFALFCYSYSMCSGLKHVKFSSDIGSKCTNHYNTILCTYICPWKGIIQDWPQACNYHQCNIHTTILTKIRQSCSNLYFL